MNRHSTASILSGRSILLAVCGRIGVPGGNIFSGQLMPIGSHSDERDPKHLADRGHRLSGHLGTFPPNVMPEEIRTDIRSGCGPCCCGQSNPLRSYADTTAYEQAFTRLDLLVTANWP